MGKTGVDNHLIKKVIPIEFVMYEDLNFESDKNYFQVYLDT